MTVKKLLPVVALVAAAAAYWFLLLAPKRQEAADLGTKVAQAESQVQTFEATAASYEAARKSYTADYARLTRLGKAVPADDDLRSLIVQLDATAAERDVDLQTLEASGGSSGASTATGGASATGTTPPPGTVPFGSAGMAALPLSLTLTGAFHDLSAVLGDLEKFVTLRSRKLDIRGRLLRVESVSLAPGETGSKTLRAQVKATAYLMPTSAGVNAGAAPAATDAAAAAAPSTGGATPPAAAAVTAPTGVAR